MDNTDPRWSSICPRCFREVSNKAYFVGAKGSAHFRGKCNPTPSPYFVRGSDIETYQEYAAKWVVSYRASLLGGAAPAFAYQIFDRPRPTVDAAEQWIAAHPEIAHANRMSMGDHIRDQAHRAGLSLA